MHLFYKEFVIKETNHTQGKIALRLKVYTGALR